MSKPRFGTKLVFCPIFDIEVITDGDEKLFEQGRVAALLNTQHERLERARERLAAVAETLANCSAVEMGTGGQTVDQNIARSVLVRVPLSVRHEISDIAAEIEAGLEVRDG
ncbi:MAG: hypothetical protein HRT64_12655 [Erythrobacter sp.]|nr:hypothetical protein [Erythrobacter sp.]